MYRACINIRGASNAGRVDGKITNLGGFCKIFTSYLRIITSSSAAKCCHEQSGCGKNVQQKNIRNKC